MGKTRLQSKVMRDFCFLLLVGTVQSTLSFIRDVMLLIRRRSSAEKMRPQSSLLLLSTTSLVNLPSFFSIVCPLRKNPPIMSLQSCAEGAEKDPDHQHDAEQQDTPIPETNINVSNKEEEEEELAQLEFCRLIGRLKTTPRTGWVRRQVPSYESVADHSWRVAAMAALLQENDCPVEEEDTKSASPVLMAIVHDLAECIVGDICPEDQVKDKHEREAKAMHQIVQLLQTAKGAHGALAAAFQEYETRTSPTSQWVKDMDGLDMILQASEYEERFGMENLDDFFRPRHFYNEKIQRLVNRIKEERNARKMKETSSSGTPVVSLSDQAFIEEHARASPLSEDVIANVVVALRQWEQK